MPVRPVLSPQFSWEAVLFTASCFLPSALGYVSKPVCLNTSNLRALERLSTFWFSTGRSHQPPRELAFEMPHWAFWLWCAGGVGGVR